MAEISWPRSSRKIGLLLRISSFVTYINPVIRHVYNPANAPTNAVEKATER
jgi:hypothetical protein